MASMAMTAVSLQQQPHQIRLAFAPARIFNSRSGMGMAAGVKGRRLVIACNNPIDNKVKESIKVAEETCAENPASAECTVAWDDVEELSAEAAHQRERSKDKDPLETFCKDNPESDECRVYDN